MGFSANLRLRGDMDYAIRRREMVHHQLADRDIRDPRVLEVMGRVPRHRFVEEALRHKAYDDYPLPIGSRQTISQPYIIAVMCEAMDLRGREKVLEVGTGSGYVTALLAELAERVFTIERIKELLLRARSLLDEMGYNNVVYRVGDGTRGWREESPFDAIQVSAASPEVPEALVEQLAPGGRLVIPVGSPDHQILVRVVKGKEGEVRRENLKPCIFVKLIGEHGWKE